MDPKPTLDLESLLKRIEAALEAHSHLSQVKSIEPLFSVTRHGVTVFVAVKVKGNAHTKEISGTGEGFEEATNDLIRGLDIWAEVMIGKKSKSRITSK